MQQTTSTNDLIFTNKHQGRTHDCQAATVDISMAEILCFYRINTPDHVKQVSGTPLLVLAQNMTDDEIKGAMFTAAEWDAYKADNGGIEAVVKLRKA